MSNPPRSVQVTSETSRVDQGSKSKSSGSSGRARVLSQLKNWITVSEPSGQALKKHQKESYNKAGVRRNDPSASVKLRAPIGSIPEDAIKPAGKGPDPEELARRKAERSRTLKQACASVSAGSRASQTYSSHSSTSFGSGMSMGNPSSFVFLTTPGGRE